MSTKIRPAIEKLAEMEKRDANRKFPLFHSVHEGYAVLLEEMEKARESLNFAEGSLSMIWAHVRDNNAGRALEFAGRVRRITGYLVGTLDRFNNAKQAEVNDRVKHDIKISGKH